MEEILQNTEQTNKLNDKKILRDSRFELLRILCMLLIVAHHFSVHGGYVITETSSTFNVAIIHMLSIGGKVGVNIFILLSGYFLLNSKFKLSKLLKLISQVFFYSITIYVLVICFDDSYNFSLTEFLLNFFATATSRYWFFSTYIILYCLSPFLNICIKNMDKKQHLILIGFLLFLQSVIGVAGFEYFSNVGWFVTVYLIGAFLKKYEIKIFDKKWFCILIACLSYFIMILINVLFYIDLSSMTSIICFISSIFIFLCFKNMKNIGNIKIINLISATTFGIYLIHDNNYIRQFLWQKLLNCPYYFQTQYFWIFAIISILVVFVTCSIVDLCRHYFVVLINYFIEKHKKSKNKNSGDILIGQ